MRKPRENLERQALKRFEDVAKKYGKSYIVIEVESADGVTNLVKYWYCLEKHLINKPIILLHIFRQISENDYSSHLALWDLIWEQMRNAYIGKIEATRYTYRDISQLETIVKEFEKHLKLQT